MLSAADGIIASERTRLAVAVLLGHLGKRVRDVLRGDLDLREAKSQCCAIAQCYCVIKRVKSGTAPLTQNQFSGTVPVQLYSQLYSQVSLDTCKTGLVPAETDPIPAETCRNQQLYL